jgi:CubicO group peptidase (beta-lactamase class C family)
MKIYQKKYKAVEYRNKKLYVINNIDDDKLDEYSEFLIGSITKLFTIVGLLILHQNKIININNSIGSYIKLDESISKLKIIDIINHKSGLKNIFSNLSYDGSKIKFKNMTEVFNYVDKKDIVDNHNNFVYSNAGYLILGYLIEQISKLDFSKFMDKSIFKPLKMKNTSLSESNIILYNNDKKLNKYQRYLRSSAQSSGGYKSCVHDLIKFSKFTKLLNDETLKILEKLWIFNNYNIYHSGAIIGGKAEILLSYDSKWNNIGIRMDLLTNTDY